MYPWLIAVDSGSSICADYSDLWAVTVCEHHVISRLDKANQVRCGLTKILNLFPRGVPQGVSADCYDNASHEPSDSFAGLPLRSVAPLVGRGLCVNRKGARSIL